MRRWQLVQKQSKQLSPSAAALKTFILANGQAGIDELLSNPGHQGGQLRS